MKDLAYYLNLEYRVQLLKVTTEGVEYYQAFCEELDRMMCFGEGDTALEAIENFMEDKEFYIEYLWLHHLPIPEPNTDTQ